MKFNAPGAAAFVLIAAALLAWISTRGSAPPHSSQPESGPTIDLTLIPDYQSKTLRFEGSTPFRSASEFLEVGGLPLQVEDDWQHKDALIWYFTGPVTGEELTLNEKEQMYQLTIGPVVLQPYEELRLRLPFVNLDHANIQPPPDGPLENGMLSLTSEITYRADAAGREITSIHIPFQLIQKQIDLILTPLIGEALAGDSNGLRLSGAVQFSSLTDFETFSDYCQGSASTLQHDDYRMAHLLSVLDYPHFSRFSGLNPAYQYKPTAVTLRTTLASCNYVAAERKGTVEAAFFGKVFGFQYRDQDLPLEWQGPVPPDGNFAYAPASNRLSRYVIRLGTIVLNEGDTLTISVPHVQVLVESISPPPSDLVYAGPGQTQAPLQIVYRGPASFQLSLPYLPEPPLYNHQFPAVIRPALIWVQGRLGDLFSLQASSSSWTLLVTGLLILLFSRSIANVKWLAVSGWLLVAASFYYGVRGSFGLLCLAILLYTGQGILSGLAPRSRAVLTQRILAGAAAFALVGLGIYLDMEGTQLFRGLSEHELSPLTPLVLMTLVAALVFPLYGWDGPKTHTRSDLLVLVLFLAVLSLFDAFDKSLLSLLILLTGGWVIARQASQHNGDSPAQRESPMGEAQRKRLELAFGNRIVPLALLILMIFAVSHDLSSTFASEMQVLLPAAFAPLLIPVLIFISIFLTFSSIALLFVLVYPLIPVKTGYLKAGAFALFLFLVFLFGIATDDRLIASLPDLLVGRVVYYLSVPMMIGVYLDIHEFMQRENQRLSGDGKEKEQLDFQTASGLYFKNLRGLIGTAAGIVSLAAPTVYAFVSNQPLIATYFNLLEKLVVLSV